MHAYVQKVIQISPQNNEFEILIVNYLLFYKSQRILSNIFIQMEIQMKCR